MFNLKLLKCFDYLRIKHSQKTWYDVIIPIILSVLSVIVYVAIPKTPAICGPNGLIVLVNNLFQILVGFYIASLAAVATFSKKGMDDKMPGVAPVLRVRSKNNLVDTELTRRRFLCLLFGYLSALSIFIYFVGGITNLLSANLVLILDIFAKPIKMLFLFIYLVMLYNLVITTLLGLYYMVDRIHRSDPKIVDK